MGVYRRDVVSVIAVIEAIAAAESIELDEATDFVSSALSDNNVDAILVTTGLPHVMDDHTRSASVWMELFNCRWWATDGSDEQFFHGGHAESPYSIGARRDAVQAVFTSLDISLLPGPNPDGNSPPKTRAERIKVFPNDGQFTTFRKVAEGLAAVSKEQKHDIVTMLLEEVRRRNILLYHVTRDVAVQVPRDKVAQLDVERAEETSLLTMDVGDLLGLEVPAGMKLVEEGPNKKWVTPQEYAEMRHVLLSRVVARPEGSGTSTGVASPPSPIHAGGSERDLYPKGRNTALCIIAALAKLASLSLEQPFKAGEIISTELLKYGVRLGKDAIALWIKDVDSALEARRVD